MKTHPKNQERVKGLQLHPEQTSPNTNSRHLYKVVLFLKQEKSASLTVPATSESEASQWASMLAKNLNMDWGLFWEEISVQKVEQVREGGRHV